MTKEAPSPEPNWPIDLISSARVKPDGKHDSGLRLTFRIGRTPDWASFEVTIGVPAGVDDADAVKIARSYFHGTMDLVARRSSGWALSKEERQVLIKGS